MKKIQNSHITRSTFRTISALSNLSLICLLYGVVWYHNLYPLMPNPFYRKGNWLVIAIYALLQFVFTKIYGGYRVGDLRITELIYSQTLALLLTNIITYFQDSLLLLAFAPVVNFLLLLVSQFILITIFNVASNKLFFIIFSPREVLLIAGSELSSEIYDKLSLRHEKYTVTQIITTDEPVETILETIKNHQAVVLCDLPSELRNDILKYCYRYNIRTYTTLKISDVLLRSAEHIQLLDTPLILNRNAALTIEQRFLKRVSDIVMAAIGLALLCPVYLVVAAAIKLDDGGPVLYKQQRLTLNGKKFMLYKFRSMQVDAERDGVARLACENDERITRVGKVIRKLRLDEIPQLFNILKGDMSVVGPRPERPEIAEEYNDTMPEFSYRLKVKAGLTGYAQVFGRYNTTPYDKLKLDLMYIENYSILLDLKILFLTIKILFLKESTEGISQEQTTALLAKKESD